MATSSSQLTSACPLPDVSSSTGPAFVAHILHWGLFGILTAQVYLYYLAFPRDSLRSKSYVYVTYALAIVQTIMMASDGYSVFGANYGNIPLFDNSLHTWFIFPFLTGIISFISQTFYAYRIIVLSRKRWIGAVIIVLGLVQLGGAIASAVIVKEAVLFSRLRTRRYSISTGIWNGGSALCDVIIAATMTYYLSSKLSGGHKTTQSIIRRVITLVIETGTATALVAIAALILTDLKIKANLFQIAVALIAEVYANSMMVVLNSRIKISSRLSESELSTLKFNFDGEPGDKLAPDSATSNTNQGDFNSVSVMDITEDKISSFPTRSDTVA